MKSIMMFAALAVCGLSVLVSGCKKEEPKADAKADTNKVEKAVKDAAKAPAEAPKAK